MLFIRFTTDAKKDLDQGASYNVFTEQKLDGLCGFICKDYDEPEDRAKKLANWVGEPYAQETEGQYAVFEGEKIEDGIDGCVFAAESIVETGNAFD
jgi:hypothetical protein